jgi:hypothetical protein
VQTTIQVKDDDGQLHQFRVAAVPGLPSEYTFVSKEGTPEPVTWTATENRHFQIRIFYGMRLKGQEAWLLGTGQEPARLGIVCP